MHETRAWQAASPFQRPTSGTDSSGEGPRGAEAAKDEVNDDKLQGGSLLSLFFCPPPVN